MKHRLTFRSPARIGLLLFALSLTGCVSSRPATAWAPANVASASFTKHTAATLAQHSKDADPGAPALREAFVKDPSRELAFVLAEHFYVQGDRAERENADVAIDFYYQSCSFAYYHLFGISESLPVDPRMWHVYHSSLARCLHVAQARGRLDPHKGLTVFGPSGPEFVPITHHAGAWKADEFDQLLVVGDYDASDLKHRYRRD